MACQVIVLIRAESTDKTGEESLLNHVIPTFMKEIISNEGFLIYIYIYQGYFKENPCSSWKIFPVLLQQI